MSRNYVSHDDMMEIARRIREQRGAANGVAPLDESGHVPAANLPSYVDDVLEYATKSDFPDVGESGKIYIAADTNMTYRWSGTQYVEISSSLALGETASTAYPGDKGKANAAGIAEERTARASADTALGGRIDTETSERKSADTAINNKIGDMGSLATSAKGTLVAAINEAAKSPVDDLHNILSGGRNLLTVLGVSTLAQAGAELRRRSDAKDYSGLMLGDWLDILFDYGSGPITARYEIASFNQYHLFDDGTETDSDLVGLGNIVFLARTSPCVKDIGVSEPRRYFGSELDVFLRGLATKFEAVLGATFKAPKFCQQYNDGDSSSPVWYSEANHAKLFLPSIRELTGEHGLGCGYYDNSHQFPLLALVPSRIPVPVTQNDATYHWQWTRTPSRYPVHFCGVSGYGDSASAIATAPGRLRLAFCL